MASLLRTTYNSTAALAWAGFSRLTVRSLAAASTTKRRKQKKADEGGDPVEKKPRKNAKKKVAASEVVERHEQVPEVAPKVETQVADPGYHIPQDQAAYDELIKTYKNAGYFEHQEYSFYDIEFDMAKLRVPQPSARR